MDQLNPTAYVILGLVSKEPRSGYEIKAVVDGSTRFFWAASYGQIYPELKRLAEAGLVSGVEAPTGGRRRTVYEITADGEEELRTWLRQPPQTFEMREEGLLKLFFANLLPPEEAVEILRAMRAHRLAVNAQLRAMEAGAEEKQDPFPLLVLRGGIEFTEWFADWCERMEAQILASAAKEPTPTQRRS
jgi:DNA-binding PadR family transcriptional regulator